MGVEPLALVSRWARIGPCNRLLISMFVDVWGCLGEAVWGRGGIWRPVGPLLEDESSHSGGLQPLQLPSGAPASRKETPPSSITFLAVPRRLGDY